MATLVTLRPDHYESVIRRFRSGWAARRNGCGFLCWERRNDWQGMTDEEARIVLATEPLPHCPRCKTTPIEPDEKLCDSCRIIERG